jgi:L-lactate dehydrogenase complex protein LldF
VYGAIGGHAYGWVYPGPMGSVLTPLFTGLDTAYDLPNACTLNGRCKDVCPVKIPLPSLLRELRHDQFDAKVTPAVQRIALKTWAFFARRPRLYHALAGIGIRLLARYAGRRGRFSKLPFAGAWTATRDLPAPQGETFQQAWRRRTK